MNIEGMSGIIVLAQSHYTCMREIRIHTCLYRFLAIRHIILCWNGLKLTFNNLILLRSNLILIKHWSGWYTSSIYWDTYNTQASKGFTLLQLPLYVYTSPRSVFSILPFTILAYSGSLSILSWAVMMGVLITRDALIISLIRGTPRVICIYTIQLRYIPLTFL